MSHYAVHRNIERGLASPNAQRSVVFLMPDDLGNDPEILEDWYNGRTRKLAELILQKNGGNFELAFIESVEKLISLADSNGLEWLLDEVNSVKREIEEELAISLEEWAEEAEEYDVWDDPAVVNGLWDQD